MFFIPGDTYVPYYPYGDFRLRDELEYKRLESKAKDNPQESTSLEDDIIKCAGAMFAQWETAQERFSELLSAYRFYRKSEPDATDPHSFLVGSFNRLKDFVQEHPEYQTLVPTDYPSRDLNDPQLVGEFNLLKYNYLEWCRAKPWSWEIEGNIQAARKTLLAFVEIHPDFKRKVPYSDETIQFFKDEKIENQFRELLDAYYQVLDRKSYTTEEITTAYNQLKEFAMAHPDLDNRRMPYWL